MSRLRPTIADVAKKSGLSVSTVSLVLNNKSNVSPETRKKIQESIAELNYHPQRTARSLASRSSGNLGFLLTNDHFSSSEPFYTKIFLGTELEARAHNYYVLLTTVERNVNATKQMPRFFLENNVDGVIIAGKIGASWLDYIRARNLPVILIDYNLPTHRVSTVSMDNLSGGRMVVEHLLGLGHKRIGFIGGDIRHPSIAERYTAYKETMHSAGIEILPGWVSITEEGTQFGNGQRAAEKILKASAGRPTAVFAANDALALGCIQYCRQMSISVPGTVAVAGFDGVEAGLLSEPRLTTVNVHREEMGGIAARRLVEMILDESDMVNRTTTSVELVIRESCGGKSKTQVAAASAIPA